MMDNQVELYFLLDDVIKECNQKAKTIDEDTRVFLNVIVHVEGLNILIENPNCPPHKFQEIVSSLYNSLFAGNFVGIIQNKPDGIFNPLTVTISNGKTKTFMINSLNYYLKEALNESLDEREERVTSMINSFLTHFESLIELHKDEILQVKKTFETILKDTANRYYILSNLDITLLIDWLIICKTQDVCVFDPDIEVRNMSYKVHLDSRSIYVSGRRTSKNFIITN